MFLKQLRDILLSEGICVSELKQDSRSNAVNIYIYGNENIDKFKKYLYEDSHRNLSRKYDKFFFIETNSKLHINR